MALTVNRRGVVRGMGHQLYREAPPKRKRETPLATKWRWKYEVGKTRIVVPAYTKSEARSKIALALGIDRLPAGAKLERLPPLPPETVPVQPLQNTSTI